MEQSQASAIECLPPGTQRIEDERGAHIVLSPVPSSDPNQPLVSYTCYIGGIPLTMTELANVEKGTAYDPSMLLLHLRLCGVGSSPMFLHSIADGKTD